MMENFNSAAKKVKCATSLPYVSPVEVEMNREKLVNGVLVDVPIRDFVVSFFGKFETVATNA
jgi:hypothetical protein